MHAPSRADTVTVGCKLPNGFCMQLSAPQPFFEQMFGGGVRESEIWRRTGEEFTLQGPALDFEVLRSGRYPTYPIVGGYALTTGVPRKFWEEWRKQNLGSRLLDPANPMIICRDDLESAQSEALEHAAVESGLEPIDPQNHAKRDPAFRRITRDTGARQSP